MSGAGKWAFMSLWTPRETFNTKAEAEEYRQLMADHARIYGFVFEDDPTLR